MIPSNEVLEKLKKILAKANGDGATEAEMQTAMAMAQKLAMAHNIDLASIKLGEEATEPVIETDRADIESQKYDKKKAHHDPLAVALMECFQVKFIYLDYKSHAAIVGERVDVQLAVYCYHWLDGLFPELYRKYAKSIGLPASPVDRVRRRSYFEGLGRGIRESNKRQVSQLSGDDANKYALVLVSKQEVVANRYAAEFPKARAAVVRPRRSHDGAYFSGLDKGREIKLNHGLSAGKAQLT